MRMQHAYPLSEVPNPEKGNKIAKICDARDGDIWGGIG
jgi:hypothetical protein